MAWKIPSHEANSHRIIDMAWAKSWLRWRFEYGTIS